MARETPRSKMDAALLQRIQKWDAAALAQVYDAYYERIYRYIYCYLGRADAAEDLTASVFTRLLSAIHRGKSPRSNLSAWLYRVAHNLVVDIFRRRRADELELVEWLEGDEPDLTHTVEQKLQLERVRGALRQLTPNQRVVIVLKFMEGMESHEIAEILDKTEGAVDALQHRALVTLRRALAQDEEPPASSPLHPEESSKGNVEDDAATSEHSAPRHQDTETQRISKLFSALVPLRLRVIDLPEAAR